MKVVEMKVNGNSEVLLSNEAISMEKFEEKREMLRKLITNDCLFLSMTSALKELPKPLQDVLRVLYKGTQEHRVFATILNACFTEQKVAFAISKRRFVELIEGDVNCKRTTVDSKFYKSFWSLVSQQKLTRISDLKRWDSTLVELRDVSAIELIAKQGFENEIMAQTIKTKAEFSIFQNKRSHEGECEAELERKREREPESEAEIKKEIKEEFGVEKKEKASATLLVSPSSEKGSGSESKGSFIQSSPATKLVTPVNSVLEPVVSPWLTEFTLSLNGSRFDSILSSLHLSSESDRSGALSILASGSLQVVPNDSLSRARLLRVLGNYVLPLRPTFDSKAIIL